MNILNNSLLNVLLTLAATFVGLSIFVQVIQELYKYLRSTKGRAYQKALKDFLGPLASELLKPGVLPDIRVRGPFQLKRVRPKGFIMPLKSDELSNALERTAPAWIQRTLNQLKLEVEFQSSKPVSKSISWERFLKDLGNVEQGTTGYWNAFEIAEFLSEWKYQWKEETVKDNPQLKRIGSLKPPAKQIDANQLLLSFKKRFLPYVQDAKERFSQLGNNFNYSYSRANRRLTFIIALLITILFNLRIDVLYKNAQQVDPTEAIKFAETTLEIYNNKKDSLLIEENLKSARELIDNALRLQTDRQNTKYLIDFSSIPNPFAGDFTFFLYLLYSFLTALFITFGAPFWNDIASALLRLQKGKKSANGSASTGENNG
jgi:hypothetical protein